MFSFLKNILPNKGPVTQNVRGGNNFHKKILNFMKLNFAEYGWIFKLGASRKLGESLNFNNVNAFKHALKLKIGYTS